MPHLITYLRSLGHKSAVLPFQDCHLGAEEGIGRQGPGTAFRGVNLMLCPKAGGQRYEDFSYLLAALVSVSSTGWFLICFAN